MSYKSKKEIILVVQGENDSKLNVVRGKEMCGFMVYIYRMKAWEDAGEISIHTFGCGWNIVGF